MKKKGVVLLLGLIVTVSSWWITRSGSLAQPEAGVLDVWTTWGKDADQLQSLFDRYSQSGGIPVRVTTRASSDDLLEALASSEQPDMVILSSNDLVGAYAEQDLVEPLDGWIEATGIDLEDIYPAPLEQCKGLDGALLCLPWGCDVDALFWNKDLFETAGLDPERPPQTMEELVEYANKLTRRDEAGELVQVGFIPDFARSHVELYARMLGGALYSAGGFELTANSQPVVDALAWQRQFYSSYGPEELKDFEASFTPYMSSRHPMYAGRRMRCQQCHRYAPIQSKRVPDAGFYESRIAMMIDAQWQAGLNSLSGEQPKLNFGVAPFPPLSAHGERAGTTVVHGPVVLLPAGALDIEAAAHLLAWMMSPQIVADSAYASSTLPSSRLAAQDPRFQQTPHFRVFMDLLDHPNAKPAVTTPISAELNEALGRVEAELLQKGGNPFPPLDEAQAELAPKLEKALSNPGGP